VGSGFVLAGASYSYCFLMAMDNSYLLQYPLDRLPVPASGANGVKQGTIITI